MDLLAEIESACSALGCVDGEHYVKEPDCNETLNDIIRFLRRDSKDNLVRRHLCDLNFVRSDLLPLLKEEEGRSSDLTELLLKLLANVTQPAILCFDGKVPRDPITLNYYQQLQLGLIQYKVAFAQSKVFAILTDLLKRLLELDWENRQEEDRLNIERILLIVRNILHVPPSSADRRRPDDDVTVHDQIVWAVHSSGFSALLQYLANASGSRERQFGLLTLEIISLLFRDKTAECIAKAGVGRTDADRERDRKKEQAIVQREEERRKASLKRFSGRHGRFHGSYWVKNVKAVSDGNDLVVHKRICRELAERRISAPSTDADTTLC